MENAEICKETELFREIAGNVTMVEVYAGNRPDFGIIECMSTEYSGVVTNSRSNPIGGQILRI